MSSLQSRICWSRLSWQKKEKVQLILNKELYQIKEDYGDMHMIYYLPEHRYIEWLIFKDIDERCAWYSPLGTERYTSFHLWYRKHLQVALSAEELDRIIVYYKPKR